MPRMLQVGTSGPLCLVETLPALEGDGHVTIQPNFKINFSNFRTERPE